MKILITTGGGGHFAASLPVIRKLKNESLLLVLRKYAFEGEKTLSFESQIAKEENIPFATLESARLSRTLSKYTFLSLAKLPKGFLKGFFLIKSFKPDVVLSFGGFTTIPIVISSAILRIPIVIHEQTFAAGLANRIASKFAKKICISWESSKKFFPKEKTVLTGIPIDTIIANDSKIFENQKGFPILSFLGGSSGSHSINVLIEPILEKLLKEFFIIHQTGETQTFNDFDRLTMYKKTLQKPLQDRYQLIKFTNSSSVNSIISRSDFVVSRSGINTVARLLYFRTPSLLIPLPFGQKNEQLKNAQFLKQQGLAEILLQQDLVPEKLLEAIQAFSANIGQYKKHEIQINQIVPVDASERIISVVKETI